MQVLVLPLEMVVAGGGVVVDTGEGVVVEASNVKIVLKSVTVMESNFNSPEIKLVVTCAEQQTTARKPLLV